MEKETYLFRNIKSKIDWGYAKEYIEYAYKIMQKSKPDFYIIGTGQNNTVAFC